jgi:hypothetical protein
MLLLPNVIRYSTRFALFCAGLMLMSACTPTLNWREVRFEAPDGTTLKAELPCKPDVAMRKQQLGSFQIELSMMGCLAGDTTFTLSRIPLVDPLSAPKVLAAWQAAAAANVKATPAPLSIVTVSGASAWPAAARGTLVGEATPAQMLWFSKQTSTGLTLYQAALYGKPPSNEAENTFFESLQLQ